MTTVMLICIGITMGMCNQIVKQEYTTFEACMADRDYQRKNNLNVVWIVCEKKTK